MDAEGKFPLFRPARYEIQISTLEKQNMSSTNGASARLRKLLSITALLILTFVASALSANAQTAQIYGSVGNFDVINHTGHHSHGFEIELEGVHPEDIPYHFSYQRYGTAQITATTTGTRVRWESPYVDGAFTATTLPHLTNSPFAGSCYMGGANYDTSACEHFGVSLSVNPTRTTYRWLIEDPSNPGTLIGFDPPSPIVSPVYTVVPPAVEGEAPELEVEFEALEPAEAPELYGDAHWVKTFKTEVTREIGLDELVTTNDIVPMDQAEVETEWELVQDEPLSGSNSNGNRRQRRHSSTLRFDTRAVVRRFEVYTFNGQYDPITHEAICADLLCNAPSDGELGEFQSAQMTAANVQVSSLTVAKTGSGDVNSDDRLIRCGVDCVSGYADGTAVTLTAVPARDFVFTGWEGDCAGNLLTCVVNVNNASSVVANFKALFAVSVKVSGKGTVNAPAAGIACGKTCSNKAVVAGTDVVFTAVANQGQRFTGWSGACSGSALTCTVNVNAAKSVQANFAK